MGLDQGIEPVSEVTCSGLGCVLVDQGSAHSRMTHAMHEFARRRPGLRNQVVARVTKIVEMEPLGKARGADGIAPSHVGPPVSTPWSRAPLPREH